MAEQLRWSNLSQPPCCAKKIIRSMRARRFSRHTSVRLDNYFHIDRSNFFLVTTSLPGTTVDPFPKNRAHRSIGLLSVLAHWYAKHLMLCTRFACCADRWFLKAPQSRNRCASASPSPGAGALSRCVSVSVKRFIALNSSRLERGTLGDHPIFDIAPERDQ